MKSFSAPRFGLLRKTLMALSMQDPRMKVVIAGPDGAGKSCLLSFLKKTMEDRFNSVMSVMVEAPLMLRMETRSKESKYAKVFEFWEDSKITKVFCRY
ncbi:hypothetical protein BGW36DRAFT_379554 [Talaromyces proteolyticus]|uniref:Uncharacterized protein n=1 Tax=Talaromyces proteolyticus TaxID=1131652 RepID=A0AAD4KQ69_9EURO|nr:uncharacterized protein BGW36DRAFT_379554 [Talaromyces proteolyticus]KAH8697838.1 hypothetical protein BGW36DRAFT_379554 [Talaromyces proteolyticus]